MQNLQSAGSTKSLALLGWFLVYMIAFILLAAGTATALVQAAMAAGGWAAELVHELEPDRIFRRCMVLWAAVLMPLLLKKADFHGWRDLGLAVPGETGARRNIQRMLFGLSLGLGTLGILSVVDILVGGRELSAGALEKNIPARVVSYIAAAMVIALFEEIVCRGLLFRTLSRNWGWLGAGLVTSGFFALAHFASPHPDSFEADSWLQGVGQVLSSAFTYMGGHEHIPLRMANLVLLGLVLCAFVMRTGTVWLGVGMHAGAVWVMKFNGFISDINRDKPYNWFFGQRSDTTDSLLAALLLLGLLITIRCTNPKSRNASDEKC